MRKLITIQGPLGGLLALLMVANLSVAGCTGDDAPTNITANVSPQGGTYHLEDLTVTVPPGAVDHDVQLTATRPSSLTGSQAPFHSQYAVTFDLSLAGDLQPKQPLTVRIPLTGSFLPRGANPDQALFYTSLADGSLRLMPSAVSTDEVLTANVNHLSPKILVYLDDQFAKQVIQTEAPNATPPPGGCGVEVTVPTVGRVVFDALNKNWGYGDDKESTVTPCFEIQDNGAAIRVTNKLDYILTVTASRGIEPVVNAGGIDDAMSIFVQQIFYGSPIAKGYLSRGTSLIAALDQNNLPGKIQLTADDSMLKSESIWIIIKTAISLITGLSDDRLAKIARTAVTYVDFENCLRGFQNQIGDAHDIIDSLGDIIIGSCGEQLVKGLAVALGDPSLIIDALLGNLRRVLLVGGVIKDYLHTWAAKFDARRANGDIQITFKRIPPVSPASCPTEEQFNQAVNNYYTGQGHIDTKILVCQDGWSIGVAYTPNNSGPTAIVQQVSGQWVVASFYHHDSICSKLPPRIFGLAGC